MAEDKIKKQEAELNDEQLDEVSGGSCGGGSGSGTGCIGLMHLC